jgi:pyruvate, orthophosphate dikinase
VPIITRKELLQENQQPLCQGQPAGIGVAIGPLVLDIDAVRRYSSEDGQEAVVLVREEMSTADIAGIALSAGVQTARGNRTSHAAVVARQLGKPCVCGCGGLRIDPARRVAVFGECSLSEGETITLDSNTGRVYAGAAEIVIDRPVQWLDEIRKWRRPETKK